MIRTCLIVLIGFAVFTKVFNGIVTAMEERGNNFEQVMKERHEQALNSK